MTGVSDDVRTAGAASGVLLIGVTVRWSDPTNDAHGAAGFREKPFTVSELSGSAGSLVGGRNARDEKTFQAVAGSGPMPWVFPAPQRLGRVALPRIYVCRPGGSTTPAMAAGNKSRKAVPDSPTREQLYPHIAEEFLGSAGVRSA